jgi:16S rRNA U1498 N3-methylase RsmE
LYKITSIDKKNIIFSFENEEEKFEFQEKILNLYQSIPNKLDKIELILQK